MDIPTVTPRIVRVRAPRSGGHRSQGGALFARYRSYIDECPRCSGEHTVNGAIRHGLITATCGLLEVKADG